MKEKLKSWYDNGAVHAVLGTVVAIILAVVAGYLINMLIRCTHSPVNEYVADTPSESMSEEYNLKNDLASEHSVTTYLIPSKGHYPPPYPDDELETGIVIDEEAPPTTGAEEAPPTTGAEEVPPIEVVDDIHITLTAEERNILAILVYLEAGGESYECHKAVASVVLNRMKIHDASLNSIIYSPGQFSPAHLISSSSPSDSTIAAVEDVLCNGVSIPEFVTYFRSSYYHNWEGLVDYVCIDNTYFSYDPTLVEKCK